ncbi:MAG TPA: dTMP kinase [Polyangia bacterium]|nr:dTMP kinase [Polyangia bacterium]
MPGKNEIGGGLLIALEGIDGSGTTTQLGRLAARLAAQGRRVHATREPSDGPVGRLLREILLGGHRGPDGAPVDGRAMALLFAADRRDHLRREIEPALAAGMDVITDRYLLSSLAYQSEEAARDWVEGLGRDLRPTDLTVLLDVPVSVAAARRRAAGRSTERYDEDGLQARVAANYRRLATGGAPASRRPVVILDGSRPIDDVTDAIAREVASLIAAPAC